MDICHLVDRLVNYPENTRLDESVFSHRLGRLVHWHELAALEEKVGEWSKEQPVIWNVGIGPAASFVPTLTRLLLDRTKDLYGPYDQITCVRLPTVPPPPHQASSSSAAAQHRLALEVLTEILMPMLDDSKQQLQELKQLAAEESYFGYGKFSDNLMLQAFGWRYTVLFTDQSIRWDPNYDRQPGISPVLVTVGEVWKGKRHLLLVENLHVPISLDVLVITMGVRWPSIFQNRRWLISTTSKDFSEKCRDAERARSSGLHLTQEYYSAPPLDDLREKDWAMLIKEALRDAARSICMALPVVQDRGDEEFWLHVAQRCLYYGILYHPLKEAAGSKASNASSIITSDELVRRWVAENLLFSTTSPANISSNKTSPTNTPAAIGKKQSNYYRSAYKAGKVVIQALQEYSLLPIYSVSTTSSSPQDDVITGVSKLAEDVPRLIQDQHSTYLKHDDQPKWVSFMNDHGRHVSLDWKPRETRGDTMMTTLILRGCSDMSEFPLDKLLTPNLRVLDLSYTPLNSLPPSFSNLLNLYLLSLRGCTQLQALSPPPSTSDKQTSPPLAHLENLQVLDLNAVPLLELGQQDGCNKSNLHYLDLSGSKFTTLPSEFFCEMSSLQELILGDCTNLKELPPSIAQLSNLMVLHVEGTQITSFPEHMLQKMQSLHTLKLINNELLMSLPMCMSEASSLEVLHLYNCMSLRSLPSSLSKAKCLKELHILNCISLRLQPLWEHLPFLENLYIQTWEGLEGIKILGHPNLRSFSLSGPWVRFLSLHGCSKLKSVNFSDDLTALEGVDLSGTAIEEVPHNLPNLPQLNTLLLVGVPCFKRFPWHQLVRFPKVFYLDHCATDEITYGDKNRNEEKTRNTAQVNINDPRMFHSFNADVVNKLVKEGKFLLSFNVQAKPCSGRGKEPRKNEAKLFSLSQRCSAYRDVQHLNASSIMPMMKLQPLKRHVEISAVDQYPNGLRHILSVTDSVFIMDDAFVRSLTDLNYNLMWLEECQLQRRHQMTAAFIMHSSGRYALPYLRILQVFHLNNLLSLVEPSRISSSELLTLKLLKHIHLEDCPRLEKMFPCSLSLPELKTLVILFCSNLKTIFYKQGEYKVAPSPIPKIEKIYLQELPQLLHIHDDVTFRFETPKWEKLFVRGCQSFQQLPLLKMQTRKYMFVSRSKFKFLIKKSVPKVEVSGEHEWWDNLQLKLPEQSGYYMHLAPPEFISRKKHVIESYLR